MVKPTLLQVGCSPPKSTENQGKMKYSQEKSAMADLHSLFLGGPSVNEIPNYKFI